MRPVIIQTQDDRVKGRHSFVTTKMDTFWCYIGIGLLWSISEFEALATRVTRGHFKGAVYEHHVLLYPDLSRPPSRQQALDHMYRNLAILGTQAEESNRQGVDILVFPEYGIYGIGNFSRDSMKPFLENIPNPKFETWNPCTNRTLQKGHEVQKALSCMARNSSLYLVANMGDIKPCIWPRDPFCPRDGRYQYNTNVVFDSEGKLVARYHKKHLFYEDHFNEPFYPEVITFDTPFGTFGTYVCFDVLYEHPAIDLTKRGVGNIVFTTAWFDALPLLSAIGFHSAFAAGMGQNFLAANIHLPDRRAHGSGIYTPHGALQFYYNAETDEGKLLVAELQTVNKSQPKTLKLDRKLDKSMMDVVFKSRVFHDEFNFVMLSKPSGFVKVLQNNLSCALNYSMAPDARDVYAFGAFDGLHTAEGSYYLQICSLLRCNTSSPQSCGSPTTTSNTVFDYLNLTGSFETTFIFPEVVLSKDSSLLLSKTGWSYSNEQLISQHGFKSPLLSSSLFGRIYSRDIQIPSGSNRNMYSNAVVFAMTTIAIHEMIIAFNNII